MSLECFVMIGARSGAMTKVLSQREGFAHITAILSGVLKACTEENAFVIKVSECVRHFGSCGIDFRAQGCLGIELKCGLEYTR